MLLHVYSADLIMLLIPFTKIAHCVLAPLSQAGHRGRLEVPCRRGRSGGRHAGLRGPADLDAGARLQARARAVNGEVCAK